MEENTAADAWKALMLAYSQELQVLQVLKSIHVSIEQSNKLKNAQAKAVLAALEKLSEQLPENQLDQALVSLAKAEGGLPASKRDVAHILYAELARSLPNEGRAGNLLERTLFHAKKYPTQDLPAYDDNPNFTDVSEKRAPEAHVQVQVPQKQGILGRMMSATVNSVVNLFVSKPSAQVTQDATVQDSAVVPVVEEPKGPPTQAQLDDAWKSLMKTYAAFVSYNQEIEKARKNLVAVFFDKENAAKILTVELSKFQGMVSHLSERDLHDSIHAFVEKQSLPKGDYSSIFVTLRGCLPHGELRELFVDTFEPAALAWKQQEKRDTGIVDAWQHLMSVYKVVAGNVNDAGSIRLLCIELRVFKDLVEKNFGAEILEDKVVELMKTLGLPIKMSSETKDELLRKVAREPDGHKLLGLLELMLQTPLNEPRKGLETKNTDQDRFSHK